MRLRCLKRVVALLILPALSFSLVLPVEDEASDSAPRPTYAEQPDQARQRDYILEYHPDDGEIKFTIPCMECEEEDKEALEEAVFAAQVLPTDKIACSSEQRLGVKINDLELDGNLLPPSLQREGIINGVPQSRWSVSNEFKLPVSKLGSTKTSLASWESNCICLDESSPITDPNGTCKDTAYILSFELPSMGDAGHRPGFTLTYKQGQKPEILRLSPFPSHDIREKYELSRHWQEKSLLLVTSQDVVKPPENSRANIDEVNSSTAESVYHTSEPYTSAIIYNTALTLSTTSQDSLPTLGIEFISLTKTTEISLPTPTQDAPGVPTTYPGQLSYQSSVQTAPHLRVQGTGPLAAILHQFEELELKAKSAAHAFSQKFHDLPMCKHHEVLAQTKVLPSRALETSQHIPTQSASHSQPTTTTNHSAQTSSKPHDSIFTLLNTDSRIPHPLKITSIVLLIISLSGVAFALVMRDPRRRADMLARREERQNKRLYRRAVRRQKFENFFNKIRGVKPIPRHPVSSHEHGINWTEWNEKQSSSSTTSRHVTDASMQEEIHALRKAHTFVDGIINAEEGRQREGYRKPIFLRRERRPRRFSATDSEKSTPPPYEEHPEFRLVDTALMCFAPPDMTPDSSVVSTSPRTSVYFASSDSEKE